MLEKMKRLACGFAALFLFGAITTLPVIGAPNPVAKTLVQGGQASGSTNSQYPVVVGGTTSGGANTILRTDSNGSLIVTATTVTATQEVEGEVAEAGSATNVKPVVVGVRDSGTIVSGARSASLAHATTGTGLLGVGILTFDGTNFNRMNGGTFANDGRLTTDSGLFGRSYGYLFNGTTWDRTRSTATVGTTAVGNWMVELSDSSAVQAAAYAANDLVGGKRTFTNAVRASGGTAHVKGVTIVDQANNSAANSVYDLILFNSDPSSTTFTENSPLDVADADMSKIVGVIRLDGVAGSTLFAHVDNCSLYKACEVAIIQSGTTSLFAALIARGAPTYAATTDVIVKLQVEQD